MTELAATIRPARPSDAATIARVHVETWRAAYPALIPKRYLVGMTEQRQRANWHHWVAAPGRSGAVMVAKAPAGPGPEIVGFGSCGAMRASAGSAALPYRGEIFNVSDSVAIPGDFAPRLFHLRLRGFVRQRNQNVARRPLLFGLEQAAPDAVFIEPAQLILAGV